MGESDPRSRNANAMHYHYANGPFESIKYKIFSMQHKEGIFTSEE